jgi:hypothetical protein
MSSFMDAMTVDDSSELWTRKYCKYLKDMPRKTRFPRDHDA